MLTSSPLTIILLSIFLLSLVTICVTQGRTKSVAWLVNAAAGFFLLIPLAKALTRLAGLSFMEAGVAGEAIIMVLVILYPLIDGRGFRKLGLAGAWKMADFLLVPALVVLYLAGTTLSVRVAANLGFSTSNAASQTVLQSVGAYSVAGFAILACAMSLLAGVSEELFFRGYLITRLEEAKVPAWAFILITGFLFGMGHATGQGAVSGIGKSLFMGIPYALYFWKRRSLGPLILAHTLQDVLGLMAAYAVGTHML